jgi:hypothetical protein
MTSIDGGEIDAWLSQVKSRLQNFTRDSLFDASITPDRAWWAQTFEACDQTHKKLTEITRNLGHSDGTCWQLANRSPTRVSYRGRRIYAYQLAYWAGNALLPASGEVVRHKCHNRCCINPEHLIHGTQRDNLDDELTKLLGHPNVL